MLFAYSILSHLLADFVFQPKKLVEWKYRSNFGVFVHVAIHFLILLLVFSPFIFAGNFWVIAFSLAICVIHFFIDVSKVSYDKGHFKRVKSFLIDQFAHLFTILVVVFIFQTFFNSKLQFLGENGFAGLLMDINFPIILIILVFSSYFIEIFKFTLKLDQNKKPKVSFNYLGFYLRAIIPTGVFIFLSVWV